LTLAWIIIVIWSKVGRQSPPHQQNLKNLFAFSGFSAAFPVADKRDKLTSWDPISWI
jgi:hypothetical protein